MTTNARWPIAAMFLLLLAAFAVKGALLIPPSPPSVVQQGAFDTSRALDRLERILGDERPHPVDSDANDAVRARLIAELRTLGLSPQVRSSTVCAPSPRSRVVSCTRVANVRATFGPAAGKHLLLNVHYDSSPVGPGAADDGIGIATLLEVAHLLRDQPLARPVTLLFNEGEEFGLLGAEAFLATDPLAANVSTLINIEARGVSGPALMFETDAPNGAAIADYARSTRRPYANSIMTDMATLIPNSTDVQVFKPRRWQTLSYSIIGNETRYHSSGDTIAALDRRSVHHLGSEVLAAARTLAGSTSNAAPATQLAFTDIAGRGFIAFPLILAAALLGLLMLAAAFLAWRRRALGRALGLLAAAWTLGSAGGWLAGEAAALIRPGDYFRSYPLVAYLACYATALVILVGILRRWGGSIDRERLRIAAWLLILIIGALLSLLLPGATIFFLIGPALALLGIAIDPRWTTIGAALRWMGAAFFLLQIVELLAAVEMLLIDGPVGAVAPLATLVALPFLVEADPSRGRLRWLAAIAVLLWLGVLFAPRASDQRPGRFSIDYVRDDLRGTAHWAIGTNDAPLPDAVPRRGEWESAKLPLYSGKRWVQRAPFVETPRPSLRLISSIRQGAGRTVRLQLASGGNATLVLRLPKQTDVIAMGAVGATRTLAEKAAPGPAALRCTGRSCDGLQAELRLADTAPVKAELIGTSFALPPEGGTIAVARPPRSHAQYTPDSSVRIVGYRF